MVVPVLFGVAFAAGVWPFARGEEQTVEFVAADGTTITVRAKVIGGDLRVVPLEEGTVKSSWTPVMPPIRIEAPGLEGGIKVIVKLSPTANGKTPNRNDIILVDVKPDGSLAPIGTTQDGERLTTTTSATMITAAVPDTAAILKSVQAPLWDKTKSADPVAKTLFAGTKSSACDGKYFLSDAQGPSDDPLCIEYLADSNRYRMTFLHAGYAVPTVYSLPNGIEPASRPSSDDRLLTFLGGDRGSRKALAAPLSTFDVRYEGAAVAPETRVIGRPDVQGWLLYALRESLLTTTDLKAGVPRDGSITQVDAAVATSPVTDCTAKAAATLTDAALPKDAVAAAKTGFAACLPIAVDALATSYAGEHGQPGAVAADLRKLLALGGDHAVRVDAAWTKLVSGMDATKPVATVLRPLRYLTKDEVYALPVTPSRGTGVKPTCPAPPPKGSFLPMGGTPQVACLWVMEADLDGNGQPDRLVSWSGNGTPVQPGANWLVYRRQGAAAYLDSGRVTAIPWQEIDSLSVASFKTGFERLEAVTAPYLANDRRQQVLLHVMTGAHTLWYVVATVTEDGALRLVQQDGKTAFMFNDSALFTSGGFGCYSRDGTGRIAKWGWTADRPSSSAQSAPGTLTVTPLQIDGATMKRAADDLTYHTSSHPGTYRGEPVGSPCTTADPAQRGAFVVNLPGVLTMSDYAQVVRNFATSGVDALRANDTASIVKIFGDGDLTTAARLMTPMKGDRISRAVECTKVQDSSDWSCSAEMARAGFLIIKVSADGKGGLTISDLGVAG